MKGDHPRKRHASDSPARMELFDRIFVAARDVALERGFGHVSLEAVAKKAGLSKGGLLYHFETKGDLLQAMMMRCKASSDDAASLQAPVRGVSLEPRIDLAVAALVAAAEDPLLLAPLAPLLGVGAAASTNIDSSAQTDQAEPAALRARLACALAHAFRF